MMGMTTGIFNLPPLGGSCGQRNSGRDFEIGIDSMEENLLEETTYQPMWQDGHINHG